jgi:cell division transport system ATP-binding protein
MLLEQARRASFYMNQNLYLYGPPASGKSTFAKILAKSKNMPLVDLDAKIEEVENMSISEIFAKKGEVYFREVEKRELKKLSEMKNTVVALGGGALLDEESKNIALATGRVIVMDCPKAEIKRRVPTILKLVGLYDKAKCHPNELSGGEQQRVALARALANNPGTIIADEPTGNIDPKMSLEIMNLLLRINQKGKTVIVVTHARDLVDQLNKRIVVLKEGLVVEDRMGGGMFGDEE